MANNNIKDCLEQFLELDGFLGACLADHTSGMVLGVAGGGPINLQTAAAANSEVIKAKHKAMRSLGLKDSIDDILISLKDQYHIIRPSKTRQNLFFYVVLDRNRSNLALARMSINEVENDLRV